MVYYRLGRYPEVIAQLERDLHDTQGQAAAYDLFFLAMCHARQGDTAKAQDCHDHALGWMRQKRGDLPPGGETELANFRAEAEFLLRGREEHRVAGHFLELSSQSRPDSRAAVA